MHDMETYHSPIPAILAEPWPEGVVYRALTPGWAAAEVVDEVTRARDGYETHRLSARCTGTGCSWGEDLEDTFTYNPKLTRAPQYNALRYRLQAVAQRHAEECRAMRRPPSAEGK
jgi:hypothetical protein